jgi:hypothetical protein
MDIEKMKVKKNKIKKKKKKNIYINNRVFKRKNSNLKEN